jgi:transcription elongation factor GreA
MGSRIFLTRPVFEWLIEQLVFIEENADELADFYYLDLPEEQKKIKQFFAEYSRKIESELERVDIVGAAGQFGSAGQLNEFPFIIIGSRVRLASPGNNDGMTLKVIHPVQKSTNGRGGEVTYLSALGKELLLKEVGSEVAVSLPEGAGQYRVESVKLL